LEIRRTVSKKSLPAVFETFKLKLPFVGDTSKISLQVAQAMPWFGMDLREVYLRNEWT
jgi:hypothetical protein